MNVIVEVGDTLIVSGRAFIIVSLVDEMNKPPVLTVKSPMEMIRADELKRTPNG